MMYQSNLSVTFGMFFFGTHWRPILYTCPTFTRVCYMNVCIEKCTKISLNYPGLWLSVGNRLVFMLSSGYKVKEPFIKAQTVTVGNNLWTLQESSEAMNASEVTL